MPNLLPSDCSHVSCGQLMCNAYDRFIEVEHMDEIINGFVPCIVHIDSEMLVYIQNRCSLQWGCLI